MGEATAVDIPTDWLTAEQARPLLGHCCRRTALNHMLVGTRVPGRVIRLRCQVMGGRRLTTRTWVAEYLAAISAALAPTVAIQPTPVETPEQTAERGRLAKERAAELCRRRPITPKGARG